MLHIGSETTAMPASATRSMVFRAIAGSCTESTQQCPATTRPWKPVSITASARCRSADRLPGRASRRCGGRDRARVRRPSRRRRTRPSALRRRRRPSRRGCRLLRLTTVATASSSAGSTQVSGPTIEHAWSSIRPPSSRASGANTSQVMSCCGGARVEVGADGGGAVRVGAAQRKIHAPLDVRRRPVGLAVLAARR